jgi:hypothetical protein
MAMPGVLTRLVDSEVDRLMKVVEPWKIGLMKRRWIDHKRREGWRKG